MEAVSLDAGRMVVQITAAGALAAQHQFERRGHRPDAASQNRDLFLCHVLRIRFCSEINHGVHEDRGRDTLRPCLLCR
jgi:hypothetical protein